MVNLEGLEDQIQQIEKYYSTLLQEKDHASRVLEQRKFNANREYKDVDVLKSLTWTSLKARFSGDRDEKIKNEELEYFEASKLANEAQEDLTEVIKRLNTSHNQLEDLKKTLQRKQALTRNLNKLLSEIYSGSAGNQLENTKEQEVNNLNQQLIPIRNRISNLHTCLGHLKNAQNHFNNALRELGSAKGYSDWDTFFGGGLFADSMKRNRVSNARNYVSQGQYSLNRASNSCGNLAHITIPVIQEGSFVWDTLFDNIFSDMSARQRIKDSARSVEETVLNKKKELTEIRKNLIVKYMKNKN